MTPAEYLRRAALPGRERWDHQVEAFTRSVGRAFYFLSMEQRTGKTQPTLDTAGYQFCEQRINGLLIPAMPGGAPRNWEDEINAGMLPPFVPRMVLRWEPEKAGFIGKGRGKKPKNLAYAERLRALLDFDGLAVLLVTGESTITDNFCAYALKFLQKRRVLMAADETTLLMKTPGASRTKALYHLGKRAVMRRALDGTPAGEGPLDLFAQYRFLSDDIFGTQFALFKSRFCEMGTDFVYDPARGAHREYPVQLRDEDGKPRYRNLDVLQKLIAPHTFRVRFFDVFADVPKPVYAKARFDLTAEQRAQYDRLNAEFEVEVRGLGTVTVAHQLTRYLRLQQITSGYWPSAKAAILCPECEGEPDGCARCGDLGIVEHATPLQKLVQLEDNPRVLALREQFQLSPGPAVIWGRFNEDIDNAMELCRQLGRRPVQYDGRVSPDDKHRHKSMFQGGEADTVVAKTGSAGRAVSFSAADWMAYYTSQFGLNQRLQSEVRPLTGERRRGLGIVDLLATDTNDEAIVAAHRAKRTLSDYILNERSGKWI